MSRPACPGKIFSEGTNMTLNPVITTLGRRLRLAVIGGGPGSFIGAMHRHAARLDDRFDIVAAVLSSDPNRAYIRGAFDWDDR